MKRASHLREALKLVQTCTNYRVWAAFSPKRMQHFFILSFPVGALRPVPEAAREKGSLATPFGLSFSAYTVSVPQ